jgi:uncharacterized protein YabE (DUF348 family)
MFLKDWNTFCWAEIAIIYEDNYETSKIIIGTNVSEEMKQKISRDRSSVGTLETTACGAISGWDVVACIN